ncbi:dihydrofolate reductase [Streptococcus mitis]|uniref:Dihydrofolate reductase n=1 Tax=Streptococcus mitis TaxID=28037 RepID=A0A4V0A706_STRMT|nr:dihydrofolate reductase [Streptococcus mitis]
MTKKIVAIWAQDEEGVIGKGNRLPWHLPAELQHFKENNSESCYLDGACDL